MPQIISEERGFFASILDALRGDAHRDFTKESIGRAITLLAIPMVLEMSMESLFAVVDMFWVAHLGADAVATVGLTEAVETLLYATAMGLGVATTAMVARRVGEHNNDGAAEAATQSIILGIAIAVVTGFAGAWFAPHILRLMGASDSIVHIGAGYTRVIYGSSATVMLLFLINGVFRGAGDAALAMRVLWIANLINIVLNPLLIFGLGPFPRLGVLGSGIGTTIGRSTGVLVQIWMLTRGSSRVVVQRRHFHIHLDAMLRLIRLSIGGIFQYLVGMGELDRAGAHGGGLRKRGRRRLYRLDAHFHLCDFTELGHGQRGGDTGRPEPGRQPAQAGGTGGVARRLVQHDLSRRDRRGVRHLCEAAGFDLY